MGAVGLPVFSGFRGGVSVLIGPTGGYVFSYILMALITGYVSEKSDKIIIRLAACIVSLIVCYIIGTAQYMFVMKQGIAAALAACVYPFVLFDLVKCAAAVLIGGRVKKLIS